MLRVIVLTKNLPVEILASVLLLLSIMFCGSLSNNVLSILSLLSWQIFVATFIADRSFERYVSRRRKSLCISFYCIGIKIPSLLILKNASSFKDSWISLYSSTHKLNNFNYLK